jgi:hypothetical protein
MTEKFFVERYFLRHLKQRTFQTLITIRTILLVSGPPTNDEERDAEFTDDILLQLPNGGCDHVWNSETDKASIPWMEGHKKAFYEEQLKDSSTTQVPALFKQHFYRPENAKGDSQMVLIASMLLSLHWWKDLNDDYPNVEANQVPPCFRIYAQGNPGTGYRQVIRYPHASKPCSKILQYYAMYHFVHPHWLLCCTSPWEY